IEGAGADVLIARPLFSSHTEWSWAVGGGWQSTVQRIFRDAHLTSYTLPGVTVPPGPSPEAIPWQDPSPRDYEGPTVTRSFGWPHKNDFTPGAEINRDKYETADLSGYDPAVVQSFLSTGVPTSDTRVGPFIEWHNYQVDFLPVL